MRWTAAAHPPRAQAVIDLAPVLDADRGRPSPADRWLGPRDREVTQVSRLSDPAARPLTSNGHDREVIRRQAASISEDGSALPDPVRRGALGHRIIAEALDAEAATALFAGRRPLDAEAERRVGQATFNALFGLGGFQPCLDDAQVEYANANGCDQVIVTYAGGHRARGAPVAASDAELTEMIRAITSRSGVEERRFDRSSPRVSVPLTGSGWLFAVMAVTGRPCVAIRRDRLARATLGGLARNATVDQPLARFLAGLVRARKNMLISGGTAAGKTTLLQALASAIPVCERLIDIEDSLRQCLDGDSAAHPRVVAMQAREPNVPGRDLCVGKNEHQQ
jgi:pilus assembly protein CpaF